MASIAIYIGAAFAEVAGCFAFWAWLKLGKPIWWIFPGVFSLVIFALLLTKIDSDFAKKLGAKDIDDLKNLIKKQITSEYQNSLNVITKKDILKQLESSHSADLPQNLIEQETKIITQNLKKEDIEKHKDKNIKLAKSRIKIGLILNSLSNIVIPSKWSISC